MNKDIWICDIEADGLLEDVKHVWCFVAKKLNTDKWFITSMNDYPENQYTHIRSFLIDDVMKDNENILVFHNGIAYDKPVIKKVLGYEITNEIWDTLIWSRVNNPDREGGHSLEAWGKRLKFPKMSFTDFSRYSDEMLEYCKNDVLVTEKLFLELIKGSKSKYGAF